MQVLGPPILFLRLKVSHPAVQRILAEHLWKYLKCIVLDKQDTGHEVVRRAVFQVSAYQAALRAVLHCSV